MPRKLTFEELDSRLLLAVDALSAQSVSGNEASQIYIIQFEEPAIGELRASSLVAGAIATAPTTGSKLQHLGPFADTFREQVVNQHRQFVAQAERQLEHQLIVTHEYVAALNGIAVQVTPEQASVLAAMPGVAQVTGQPWFETASDIGPTLIGASGVWDGSATGGLPGSMGEGIVVGVIDTGVNPLNPSFAEVGPIDGHTHTNPLGSGNYLGVCADGDPQGFGCNDKLIGAYDFTSFGPLDDDGHGSHTASIAAGNFVDATVAIGGDILNVQISGVAPHANIIVYDACVGRNCSPPSLVAAIDQAILDDVDVINYSISGTSNDPWTDPVSISFRNARAAGIFVAVAAGNTGPNSDTVRSPATAPWVTAVGATSHGRVFANTVDVVGPGLVPPEFVGVAALVGSGPAFDGDVGPAEILYSGDVLTGNDLGCNTYPAGSLQGHIALIQRGTCLFSTKINNAAAAGAIAAVVFNHLSGPPIVMAALEQTSIRSVFMTKNDGETLRDFVLSRTSSEVRINDVISNHVVPELADIVADFSSRGPDAFVNMIVPHVTAPGVEVLAAGGTNGSVAWEIIDGTSMATPHVAGAATLLTDLHPNWTPAEIQSALMTTAITAGLLKEDGETAADPFDRGAGRIDVNRASRAGLVLDETNTNYLLSNPATGGDPTSLNFPGFPKRQVATTYPWTRTLRSTQSVDVDWTVSVIEDEGMDILVSPAVVHIPAGGSAQLSVLADLRSATVGDTLFGTVTLSPNVAEIPDAHFPVAATFFGPDTFPPEVIAVTRNDGSDQPDQLTSLAFDFDQDVSATLSADDLVLFNETTGTPVDLSQSTFDSSAARWDLSGLSLPAAFYRVSLTSTGVSDSVGNPLDGNGDGTGGDDFVEQMLMALPGDASQDGSVDSVDFAIWSAHTFAAGDWEDGDFTHDGLVDVRDFNRWNANKFTDVLPLPSASESQLPRAAAASVNVVAGTLDNSGSIDSIESLRLLARRNARVESPREIPSESKTQSLESKVFQLPFEVRMQPQRNQEIWDTTPIRLEPDEVDEAIADYLDINALP